MACELASVNSALEALLTVFKRAASHDSDNLTLSRGELHHLIKTELPFLVQPNFEKHFESFFQCMEGNPGSNVDFKEFMCLLATIVMCRDQELSQQLH
ncbi:protein S100-Z-like [Stegostoma tigrinum]|uniref:protein S100-Z-like n=1 Tax=Stegostoma tigrinum TaxID=3053191 RepID=UPI0028702680|nr:protein S100-Z-like [Stegostoma tigrinum]XP_059494484.1 protein S100-Z-like [Stegostoma tigrinum]